MVLLDPDTFLSELTRMFQRSRTSGSVSVTMKRWDGRNKPKPKGKRAESQAKAAPTTEYHCLLRATLAKKTISTVINYKDINKFQMHYSNVLKGNIDSLKKKDKKSKGDQTKSKATQ
ncbi:RNA-binding signal recognition particle subunit srp14 [Chamberlinius hualienensis]